MTAYYKFIKREQPEDGVSLAHYQPTKHAQGAWNEHEQHMAPATGLLMAELNNYAPQANMRIARISLDILGLIPLDDFTVTTRCIRPGKTIELIEAVMRSSGRDAIIAHRGQTSTSSDWLELHGANGSPYTKKVASALRYKRIPFTFHHLMPGNFQGDWEEKGFGNIKPKVTRIMKK